MSTRAQHMPGALVRLYCERVSPLVHVPWRRQALRWTLIVLFIFAPAFPRVEMNGWAPETTRVLGNVLRIVSGVTFIGDQPPVREREEGRLVDWDHAKLLPLAAGKTQVPRARAAG